MNHNLRIMDLFLRNGFKGDKSIPLINSYFNKDIFLNIV